MGFMTCSDCGNSKIEAFGRCASCNSSRRKEERRASMVKVIRPIKKVSTKRAKEQVEYGKLVAEQLREHPECQIKILDVCTKIATTNHHAAKRGKNYLNKETFMSACLECHQYLETVMSAELRREKGLLI